MQSSFEHHPDPAGDSTDGPTPDHSQSTVSTAAFHAAQNALAESDTRRRAMLAALPGASLLFHVSGELLEWQTSDDCLPYPLDEPTPFCQIPPAEQPVIYQLYSDTIAQVAASGQLQIVVYALHYGQHERWFEARLVLVDSERVLALVRDITEQKQNEAQLQHLALHDALTGLPNRTLLYDRLQQAIKQVQRDRHTCFAVLLIDLDDFKRINDGLGHEVGDRLLAEMARRLQQNVRAVDTVARLGGDEFAVLLAAPQSATDVQRAVERIQQAVAAPFKLDAQQVVVGISIGLVVSGDWHQQAADMMRDADIALYQAKERGKGQSAFFDASMRTQVVAHLSLEHDLRRALVANELRVYYQPVVDVQSNRIHGFEALVRWQHPERGLLTPGQFLPLATKIGLDVAIDRWVLREACLQLQRWHACSAGHSLLMSVNLSNRQLEQSDLVPYVKQVLHETHVQPAQLMFEVTESSLIADYGNALEVLTQLGQLGVKIGLDDFGTGYSSLSYLHRFPVNVLKIDRTFLGAHDPRGRNKVIMRALIQLAQTLGLDVIAEGAETAAHMAQLQTLACTYVQGYYVAVPLDQEAADTYLRTWLQQQR